LANFVAISSNAPNSRRPGCRHRACPRLGTSPGRPRSSLRRCSPCRHRRAASPKNITFIESLSHAQTSPPAMGRSNPQRDYPYGKCTNDRVRTLPTTRAFVKGRAG
jgi:hypothetical protein